MTNHYNNVLYIGVTSDIVRRVAEHKAKINKGFTYKYNCEKLVYYEEYELITEAISREKQLKNWKREWKNELVNGFNPKWEDLSEQIGVNDDMINVILGHYSGDCGSSPQ
jgi:putative endonuclease